MRSDRPSSFGPSHCPLPCLSSSGRQQDCIAAVTAASGGPEQGRVGQGRSRIRASARYLEQTDARPAVPSRAGVFTNSQPQRICQSQQGTLIDTGPTPWYTLVNRTVSYDALVPAGRPITFYCESDASITVNNTCDPKTGEW